jgi:Flp pilus assembly protein TadG
MRFISRPRRSQQGAVIVTVALFMLLLLGFMGFALDFGRLFIVRTELQTAMDSCALAAAQELDGQADSIARAQSAGVTAGNLNRVNLQSTTWAGQPQLTPASLVFRAADYTVTTVSTDARYAQCQHTQASIQLWLMQALGAFSGDAALFPATGSVAASAVATRASSQTTCPLPLMLRPAPGGTAPNYGFQPGQWITLLMAQNAAAGGQIGWANLDGSNSASETEAEMLGFCGTEVGDTLGTPGVQSSITDAWNYRFGIYRNGTNASERSPDVSGYAYTALNWPSQANAFNGPTPAGAHWTAENFVTKRAEYASCADTGTRVRGPGSCEQITGLSLNSFQDLALPGPTATGGHRTHGVRSRVATVPVVNAANEVIDYACMFMLQPLSIPMSNVQLEFLGNAGAPGSPCTTSGLPGGNAGPLVPVLVR